MLDERFLCMQSNVTSQRIKVLGSVHACEVRLADALCYLISSSAGLCVAYTLPATSNMGEAHPRVAYCDLSLMSMSL